MDRKNYFEMTGLSFDPPEKKELVIKEAISRWKLNLQNLLGSSTSEIEKERFRKELSLETDMRDTLFDIKKRNIEARNYKEQKVKQLELLIDIMKTGVEGQPEVTRARITSLHRKLNLQEETVKKAYESKGYIIQKPPKKLVLSEYFMTASMFDDINRNIGLFKIDTSGTYPWCTKVEDLYDIACYLNGGKDTDRPLYHKRKTAELHDIMEKWAIDKASDMSTIGHLLNSLLTQGAAQVFSSEDNRKKYDQTFDRDRLSDFFRLLKSAPDDFKRDEFFAENCISIIQKRGFPSYSLALALYNQEAGISREPYEPVESYIHITCICKTPHQFRSREEAKKAKCTACGRSLYIKCPNPSCGKMVPVSADRCPFCNFNVFELQFFEDYIQAAKLALKNMDFAEARKQLESAKKADPANKKTEKLDQEILAGEKVFREPLENLQSLISSGRFSEAKRKAENLAVSMPKLKLDRQRKIIAEKMNEAASKMPRPTDLSTAAGNKCWEILQTAKDYTPAMEMLQKIPLQQPSGLTASVAGGTGLKCSLSWTPTPDAGVTYHVVRKLNGRPGGPLDGVVLEKGLHTVAYVDKGLQPGLSYGYGVFAVRSGIFSKGAFAEVVNYSELDASHLRYSTGNGCFSATWVLPANCLGVKVTRGEGFIPPETPASSVTVIDGLATSGFRDTNVRNGKSYGYRLQCAYQYGGGFRYSKGRTVFQKIEPMPESLKGIKVKSEGTNVTVSWTGDGRNQTVMIREVKDDKVSRIMKGVPIQLADSERLLGRDHIFANSTSDSGKVSFTIPENSSVQAAVVSISGQNMVVSEIVRLSSVDKCEIDKNETRIVNDELRLYIKKNNKLSAIYYAAATKTGNYVPWCSAEDAEAGRMHRASLVEYQNEGNILVKNMPPDDIYLTVIGEYNLGGHKVYSEPSKMKISNKPKDVIRYSMNWQTGFLHRQRKNCMLSIRSGAASLPQMYLCCKSDGTEPMSLDDPDVKILHTIEEIDEESDLRSSDGGVSFPLSDDLWTGMARGTILRLLIDPEDFLMYELSAENIGYLNVP